MKEYPKFWKFESLDLFYQYHSEIHVCQCLLGEKKLSVMSRKTFWLWGSASFFRTSGNKAVCLNLKAPAKEPSGVTGQLVLVAFEKIVKQKLG